MSYLSKVTNLQQGSILNNKNSLSNNSLDYNLISMSTMENMESSHEKRKKNKQPNYSITSSSKNSDEFKEIESLDKEFNRVLAEYTKSLKMMNDEILKKSEKYSTLKNMFGKVVINNDADKVYVNNYGYTHTYSKSAWESNNKNCPQNPIIGRENDLASLPSGPKMGISQSCYVAGKNIKNRKTNEVAWVDIKGYKHVYGKRQWQDKNKTCNINPIVLDNDSYEGIPSGKNMTAEDLCITQDVDPMLYTQVNNLNNKLLKLANEINKKSNKLSETERKLRQQMNNKEKVFDSVVKKLKHHHNDINNFNSNYETVVGLKDDSYLVYESNYYKYLSWTLASFTILGITFNQLMKK